MQVKQKEFGKWRGIVPIGDAGTVLDASITDGEFCRLLDSGYQASRNCLLVISLSQPFQKSNDVEPMCYRLIAGVIELSGYESCPIAALIEKTDQEIDRIGWSIDQARDYIMHNFQKRSRTLLDLSELEQFLNYLQKLPNSTNDFH